MTSIAQADRPAPINVFTNTRALMVRNLRPGLAECGKIKIGRKGKAIQSQGGNEFQPPQKLDHFLITTLQRGSDGNFVPDQEMHKRFGAKPTEIPVRLLFSDPWLSFQTVYTAFKGSKRFCTGDGERAQRVENGRVSEIACPCPLLDPAYTGKDKCKINGTLSVVIDGADVVGGVWKLRTTSMNTCQGIASSLALLYSVTKGQLANLPLMLTLRPKATVTPDGQATTVYIVGLEYRGGMERLQEIALQRATEEAAFGQRMAAVEEQARLLLAAPAVNEDEDDDIRDEFYPEAAAEAHGARLAPPTRTGTSIADQLRQQAQASEPPAVEEPPPAEHDEYGVVEELGPAPQPEPPTNGNGKSRSLKIVDQTGKVIKEAGSGSAYLMLFDECWKANRQGLTHPDNLAILRHVIGKTPDGKIKEAAEGWATDLAEDLKAVSGGLL